MDECAPEATQEQDYVCFALGSLAMNIDNRLKVASLVGIETVLYAMNAHPKATQTQKRKTALRRGAWP